MRRSPALLLNVGGYVLAAACAVAAALLVFDAPRKPPLRALDEATRAERGRAFAGREPMLRRRAARDFPGHLWAQSDHFAAMEQDFMRREARRLDTNVGDLVLAIDEDLRSHPPDERSRFGGVAPCKPLPFYD